MYEDKTLVCKECGKEFVFTAGEQELAGKGRVLIRPSGTEALIRVMVEAKTTEVARKVAEDLADLIKILSEKIQF